MDTVKAKPKSTVDPAPTRRSTKRDSKVTIDYAQYHNAGILSSKSPKLENPLPRASGPSLDRQAAQNMITHQKRTPTKGLPTGSPRNLNVKREPTSITMRTQTLVKPKLGIYMRHHHSKNDANKVWRYIHPSGKLCPSGESGTCSHRHSMELPDLPSLPSPPSTQTSHQREQPITPNRVVVAETSATTTNQITRSVVTANETTHNLRTPIPTPAPDCVLISPPAIVRQSTMVINQRRPLSTERLDDLLGTLNFDQF